MSEELYLNKIAYECSECGCFNPLGTCKIKNCPVNNEKELD